MKYILLIIAIGFASCKKNCITCEGTITGDNTHVYTYSQQEDGYCGLTLETYKDTVSNRILNETSAYQSLDSVNITRNNIVVNCDL